MSMRQPQDPLRQDEKAQRQRKAWWPIYGLFLMVAMAGIAVPLAPIVGDATFNQFRPGVAKDTWTLMVGGVIFFLLLMVAGMLFAFLSPKPQQSVSHITDREIDRQRKILHAEEVARKEREKAMRRKISKERKQENK